MLKINHVSKKIEGRPIFTDVSFTVQPQEVVSIVGPSGSGKTTLLKCIVGLSSVDKGTISLDGKIFSGLSPQELRKFRFHNIGLVDQQNLLLDDLNTVNNVRFILDMHNCKAKNNQERAMELLRSLRIEHRANAYPEELSGGELQRLNIACALSNSPKLLVADEPTSALDDQSATIVLKLFRDLSQQLKIPVLIVTHDHRVSSIVDRSIDFGKLNHADE